MGKKRLDKALKLTYTCTYVIKLICNSLNAQVCNE